MNLQDVIQLKEKGAKFKLVLAKSLSFRSSHSDYELYLQLKTVESKDDSPVTANIAVEAPKHYMTLERFLTQNSLDFSFLPTKENPFSTVLASEPLAGCSLCTVCFKTNFDGASGCKNSSVFSPAVGDWVCNLQARQ
jgi:hypothetical protein